VPRGRLRKSTLSKNFQHKKTYFEPKIPIQELPFATVRVTLRALRWIFLLIFVYISISIILLIIQGGNEFITNIVVYSITGFFTFFMGYFGWMFAKNVMEMFSGHQHHDEF
jgi:hypothetical protein